MKWKADIRPLSEVRANAAGMIERVRKSRRPLVLTQRGHTAAVVRQIAAGQVIPHKAAKKRLLAALRR